MVDDEFVNICSWQIKLRMIFLTQMNDKVVDIPKGQNDDWVFFQEYCWDLGIPKSIIGILSGIWIWQAVSWNEYKIYWIFNFSKFTNWP